MKPRRDTPTVLLTRRRVAALLLAVMLASLGGVVPAAAQGDYPSRPVDFVIPFPPGGPLDVAIRILQPGMAAALGQPIVLQNKGGAGGALGMDAVAKSRPDGYTVAASVKSTLTILPAQRADLPYKPADFAPVANAVTDVGVVVARAGGPWKTIDELIADAKRTPGKLSYGSAGVGTVSHLMMEIFKQSFGVDIAHVPFQGSGPVKNAILGGHVQLASGGLSTFAPLIKAGDVVALVTTAPRRIPALPGVPTMAEKGFPEATVNISVGLYVPARTPREVIARLAGALERALRDPAAVAALEKTGMLIDFEDAAAVQRALEAERGVVSGVVKKLGIGS